ncbi:hypothetical protein MLD38_008075 [Melastoma candidum]|uniref:Uncharacterized protein n=1 Tax=Melastoma candidum TaxID=119954 RepID=A0ACB9RUE7_9MYRT|nr:hypothetical protein MLD38_008075 [Melastoma candidum]
MRSTRRVQVVYYLTRDGHLQHPHYMEVPLLPCQPHLRLRDVMDRLTSLRGKGMPALYSWSCKRNYKNGYVWYDLCENDVIYPVEGAEYVLKGSEIVDASPLPLVEARFQQPNISFVRDQSFHTKPVRAFPPNRYAEPELRECRASATAADAQYQDHDHYGQAEEEYELDQGKTSSATSTPPRSQCSKGVSTDELDQLPRSSPPRHIAPVNPAPKGPAKNVGNSLVEAETKNDSGSSPFVLLQLLACGSKAITQAVKSENGIYTHAGRNHGDSHNGVLCRTAARRSVEGGLSRPLEDKDEIMIRYMSENPRFGNLQSQEKEYFSGSIVESTSESKDADGRATAAAANLKRSNSFNDQSRTSTVVIGAAIAEEEQRGKQDKLRCLPRKNSCFGS